MYLFTIFFRAFFVSPFQWSTNLVFFFAKSYSAPRIKYSFIQTRSLVGHKGKGNNVILLDEVGSKQWNKDYFT